MSEKKCPECEKLEQQLSCVKFAAHMPADYKHGLPTLVHMLYLKSLAIDTPRTVDVERIAELTAENKRLREALAGEAITDQHAEGCPLR